MNKHDNIGTFCRKCRQVICTCKKKSYYEILEDGYELNYVTMEYILEMLNGWAELHECDITLHLETDGSGTITDKTNDEEIIYFDSIHELEQKLLY